MILNGTDKGGSTGVAGRAPLDGLLRRAAEIRPEHPALSDAPNRPHVLGGEVRNLTWGELDAMVDSLAGRLRTLGLPTDSVVATQFALSSEAVIALLAISRAGLIAAPVPLGWGRRETITHLQRTGARAILTAGRAGPIECADMMRFAAAEVFSVRAVLSLGGPALDGVMPLDDALDLAVIAERVGIERSGNPADHAVLVTADASAEGQLAVARSHNEVVAGGLAAFIVAGPDERSVIGATLAPDSFAGIALQLVPWLMSGGHLIAHPPLALRTLLADLDESGTTHLVLPAAAAPVVGALGMETRGLLRHALFLARRGADAAACAASAADGLKTDAFLAAGEAGLVRITGEDGAIPLGADLFAGGSGQAPILIETRLSGSGTLQMRGAMVPRSAFPPGAEHGQPPFWATDREGFHDTGMAVRPGEAARTLVFTTQAEGVVAVGGRRFADRDLKSAYVEAGGEIAPVIKDDPLLGQRIGGVIGDGRAIVGLASRLVETGVTPLGIPGGTRQSGPLPFQDTRPPDTAPSPGRDALADTQAVLEQLLSVAKAASRR